MLIICYTKADNPHLANPTNFIKNRSNLLTVTLRLNLFENVFLTLVES